MRRVIVSRRVRDKIEDLEHYLVDELKLPEEATLRRSRRIRVFIASLAAPGIHALCRFRQWREAGYRCVSVEGWVFAYEVFDDGVIIRDMSHGKLLADVTD
jgi:plasmid stabilization system protein ParE